MGSCLMTDDRGGLFLFRQLVWLGPLGMRHLMGGMFYEFPVRVQRGVEEGRRAGERWREATEQSGWVGARPYLGNGRLYLY